jgi:hypothetical protein
LVEICFHAVHSASFYTEQAASQCKATLGQSAGANLRLALLSTFR